MKQKNIPAIEPDFLLLPWQGGIRLEKPNIKNDNLISLGDFFKFSFNVYFFTLQNIFASMNEENAFRNGHLSVNEPLGKPISKFFTEKTANTTIAYHQKVLHSQQLHIKEEHFICREQAIIFYPSLSFKFPWYCAEGSLSGVFGCSIMPEVHNLSASLSILIQLGLITKNPTNPTLLLPGKQIEQHYLSKRELDCLTLLARGHTAKMSAKQLGLSFRTVESYIENIKCKLNVYSKAELCAKAMEFGLLANSTFDR